MSYQVLARKWRPRQFSELVGQEHVIRVLEHALDNERTHHAYLFTGTRGVGKTTIARIFAKALNCERGPTAKPCGECSACVDIDSGRFVDLLEIDAASRTKVDDTRDLLDNVVYAPTRGRYKVYLIDEVHMLSTHSFNALLKTLEEPPPHVKFLLATTDPQKLPVTVLSRCLKFSLKQLLPQQIVRQMRMILEAEQVTFEDSALIELARAADGSLRDGLSLLDQAIAYGQGSLRTEDVLTMIGSVARSDTRKLIEALADGDGAALLAEVDAIALFAPDFGLVLEQLAAALHRIQLAQLVPEFGTGDDDAADTDLDALAGRLSAEEVQLYYQMAVNGRRELVLAPDMRTGFEMALLRMLAFRPVPAASADTPESGSSTAVSKSAAPKGSRAGAPAPRASEDGDDKQARPAPQSRPETRKPTNSVPPASESRPAIDKAQSIASPDSDSPDWEDLIERAELRGPLGQLARHAQWRGMQQDRITLALRPEHEHLVVEPMVRQIGTRISDALGRRVQIRFVTDAGVGDTPADRARKTRSESYAAARRSLDQDPIVQSLERELGAQVVPDSVRPLDG